jgi:pimeloyl-ACP methyl ester carboxylesterase
VLLRPLHDRPKRPRRAGVQLTIFGERNDPFGFQARWKALFPDAQQFVIPRGNHFPMCDDPQFVAETISSWHNSESGKD